MSRTKPFGMLIQMSGEFWRDDRERAMRFAREEIQRVASEPLTGPRGGRYEAVNQPHGFETQGNWPEDIVTVTARVTGRYARPKR
jgi:hypothetical protein